MVHIQSIILDFHIQDFHVHAFCISLRHVWSISTCSLYKHCIFKKVHCLSKKLQFDVYCGLAASSAKLSFRSIIINFICPEWNELFQLGGKTSTSYLVVCSQCVNFLAGCFQFLLVDFGGLLGRSEIPQLVFCGKMFLTIDCSFVAHVVACGRILFGFLIIKLYPVNQGF